jgi:hypothetical protein
MLIFNEDGFFSVVVNHNNDDEVLVRARVREDIERFCECAGVEKSNIIENRDYDYRYRVFVDRKTFLIYMIGVISSMNYTNFKARAFSMDENPRLGKLRSRSYTVVHAEMERLQNIYVNEDEKLNRRVGW